MTVEQNSLRCEFHR